MRRLLLTLAMLAAGRNWAPGESPTSAPVEGKLMDKEVLKTVLLPIVRHGLQLAAGYLVAKGQLDPTQAETLVGGLMAIGSVGWWWVTKPKRTKPAAVR